MLEWPSYTRSLFGGSSGRPWIQAQPRTKNATTPCLANAGSGVLTTRPDGMWIRIIAGLKAADVFCVEVCGKMQNFQDKRSRFQPTTSALVLKCTRQWLNESMYVNMTRWKKSGVFESSVDRDFEFPVRNMRVLFVLTEKDYGEFFKSGVPGGHEYFMKHTSFGSFSSQQMQEFLKAISPDRHFYSTR